MSLNAGGPPTKDISCQEMLQAKQFTCSGWIRRKTALQQVGAKIENTLKVNRAMSVASRIPWDQRYMILYGDKLYIFKNETATRADKILTLSNYSQFNERHEEKSKDVPWPFRLQSINDSQIKNEYFSTVSSEELQKWKDAITPRLEEESVYASAEESDSDYDKPDSPPRERRPLPSPDSATNNGGTIPLPARSRQRPVPYPPSDTSSGQRSVPSPPSDTSSGRSQRTLPPIPPDNKDGTDRTHRPLPSSPTENDGLQSRKVPEVPIAKLTKQDSIGLGKKPPVIAKKPKVPIPSKALELPKVPEEDDITYEMGIVEAAMWRKTTDEAQEFMRQSGLPEGLYLIRQSTDGKGYTLLVICQNTVCKFKIDEEEDKKVRMGSTNFNSLEALIVHFSDTNLPNKTTPLTKAHSYYIRP